MVLTIQYVCMYVYTGLPPEPHLRPGVPAQPPQELLVLDRLRRAGHAAALVARAVDLGQADLPRRVAVQLDVGAEDQQEVGFRFDHVRRGGCSAGDVSIGGGLRRLRGDLADLGVDQLHADVVGRELAVLRHLGQRLGQVDEGLAAVRGGEEEHGQGGRVGLLHRAVRLRGAVDAVMGGEEPQGGLVRRGAVVGGELAGDDLVEGRDVRFQDA